MTGVPEITPIVIKNVPRQAVLKPVHAPHRLSNQKFNLGDRVVHVLNSGIVPLSAKGTVVGIENQYIDVVFDRTFMGGTSLNDRYIYYMVFGVFLSMLAARHTVG